MSETVFNKLQKLPAPPFVTVPFEDELMRRKIFKTWFRLGKCAMEEKSSTFRGEGQLLKAYVARKGTQLRLEKALMLTRRILTLVLRWESNACWDDFCKFKDAFETDDAKPKEKRKSKKGQPKRTDCVKSSMQDIRLPSRQWANWVIYLVLRDLLVLSKIKYECERTVGYWLGMISSSHHPGDSLIIVGILSRIWAVSSGMVEDYANLIYPGLCFISSVLRPTKADNWLEDIDFPNDLFTWAEKILGFPFIPAKIGYSCLISFDDSFQRVKENLTKGYEYFLSEDDSLKRKRGSKMDKVLSGVFSSTQQEQDTKVPGVDVSSTSSRMRDLADNIGDEEDLGVPMEVQQSGKKKEKRNKKKKQKLTAQINKKVALDERWTKFFKNFKSKLDTDVGRKQLQVRIKKFKKTESSIEVNAKLVTLLKFIKQGDRAKLLIFIPKFKRFLSKRLSNKGS